MGYKTYTEEETRSFVDVAKEIGISPAMRQMGYPNSYNTAKKWFDELGEIVPDLDALMRKAADMKRFYGDSEKKIALMTAIDLIMEQFNQPKLTADDINKLTNALAKAIQTFQLVEGKSTTINETRQKDGTDLAINDLLNSVKAKNALRENDLRVSDTTQ